MSYAHLHLHTHYSLLDGANKIEAVLSRAKAMDMPAAAMTDHGNMFGTVDFYRTAVRTGVKPIIYAAAYFWESKVKSGEFGDLPLWVAHWDTKCPTIPSAWNRWAFHQHTSSGEVDGIGGRVDLNRFNGDMSDLRTFAREAHGTKNDTAEEAPTTDSNLDFEITKHESPQHKEKPAIIALDNDPNRPDISKAQCSSCDKIMTYPKRMSAKRVKCPECQDVLVLP